MHENASPSSQKVRSRDPMGAGPVTRHSAWSTACAPPGWCTASRTTTRSTAARGLLVPARPAAHRAALGKLASSRLGDLPSPTLTSQEVARALRFHPCSTRSTVPPGHVHRARVFRVSPVRSKVKGQFFLHQLLVELGGGGLNRGWALSWEPHLLVSWTRVNGASSRWRLPNQLEGESSKEARKSHFRVFL